LRNEIVSCSICRRVSEPSGCVVKSFRYLLTALRQFDILQSGPGWWNIECNSTS
jgi:hypothetical protein